MSQPLDASVSNALIKLGCNEKSICHNEDPSTLEWIDVPAGFTPPSNADILAKMEELRTIKAANSYWENRRYEYPSLEEQLDMQYKDEINGTTTWKDAIAAVKTKYPKP